MSRFEYLRLKTVYRSHEDVTVVDLGNLNQSPVVNDPGVRRVRVSFYSKNVADRGYVACKFLPLFVHHLSSELMAGGQSTSGHDDTS